MVELQPSKLNTWVRFPSPAPGLVAMGMPVLIGRFMSQR